MNEAIQKANTATVRRAKRGYAVTRGARGWGQVLGTFTVKREAERFAARAALAPYVQAVSVWTIADTEVRVPTRTSLPLHERIGFNSRLRVVEN